MPNWCDNRVTISSNTEDDSQFKELVAKFQVERPFNEIFPQPDWKTIPNEEGQLPVKREMKNDKGEIITITYDFPDGQNDDRWYHWCSNNWGTKWDVNVVESEVDEGYAEFEFQTAWAPASGIFDKIRENYPDVAISWFYDEPGMEIAGYLPN